MSRDKKNFLIEYDATSYILGKETDARAYKSKILNISVPSSKKASHSFGPRALGTEFRS